MTDLAKLVVRLEAEIGKYAENLEKAEKRLASFERNTNQLLSKVQDRLAAFFAIDKLKDWAQHILQTGDQLAKMSQSTGIAVQELSRLDYALRSSGVQGENVGKLLKELNANISDAAGNAKGEAATAFRALGISVRDATTGALKDGNAVLLELADQFAKYEDGANKSALATAFLGKTGEAAIPFLNQGADGIRRLADESDRYGATLDADTARAAEEFNDRLARMKTLAVDGVGNAIAKQLLPTLNALGEEIEGTATGIEALEHVATICATAIKLLASAGLIVGTVFDKVGETIGAVTAAQVALLTGNFREAARITADYFVRQQGEAEKFQKRLAAIWADGGDNILREVRVHANYMRQEAPNLTGQKEIEKAAEAAIKKLTEFHNQLAEQVQTFGLGEAAATKYRLEIGNLADDVRKAGTAGEKLKQEIIGEAEALQRLKDTKEITKALAEVQAQIEGIRGNAADAAIAQFDVKNADLVTKLRREGNEEGLKQLDTLIKLITAQADYNELEREASRIQGELSVVEERLRNSREAGAITELDLQKQLAKARSDAAGQLDAILSKEQKIAQQIGNPETTAAVERFGASIESLKTQVDVVGNSFRATFEDTFADELLKAEKGVQSFGEAFGNMIEGLADQLLKLANQQIAQQLIGAIAGSGTTGGGYLNAIVGAFGGGRAAGGPVLAGHEYMTNEGTDRRERFIPSVNGRIERASGGRALSVQNTFVLQTERGGTVSRQTQLQMASLAARSLADAQRRNG
jgi:hypothetical protein